MSEKSIRKVVILGGGTAGWMAANYLIRAFPENLSVTLVESREIGRIGVGEATVPTIRATLDFLGLKEEEWMSVSDAGFKNAVCFENWKHGPAKPDRFYHPFHHQRNQLVNLYGMTYFMEIEGRLPIGHYWLKNKLRGTESREFAYASTPNSRLCDLNRAPRAVKGAAPLNYAYHFDAVRFAEFLRELAVKRGGTAIDGEYVESELNEEGFLTALRLKDGRRIEGDFFLDCSGFRSHLIEGALKAKYCPQNQHLLCDSAVAATIHYKDPVAEFRPYTSAIAQDAGWIWDIPLQSRIGSGYVYSSRHSDQAAAEKALLTYHRQDRESAQLRNLKLRVGYFPQAWTKNCVAIGLAGSFLEPVESTSIFMSEFQLFQLVRHFPDLRFSPALAKSYNQTFADCFLEIRDFIVMHYCLSQRKDTAFWREATDPARIPDSLAAKLELFRERLPMEGDNKYHLFGPFNYTCILAGLGYLPEHPLPGLAHSDHERESAAAFEFIERQAEELKDKLPTVREFCNNLSGSH
ncbi:MAG: tryptophan halogenase family protein [Bdellovibrionota bacterium]